MGKRAEKSDNNLGAGVLVILVISVPVFVWFAMDALFQGRFFGPLIASASNRVGSSDLATEVQDIFALLQFVLAVLSGLVIVIAAVMAFTVGRSQREQRQQLEQDRAVLRNSIREEREAMAAMQKTVVDVQGEAIRSRIADEFARMAGGDLQSKIEEWKKQFSELENIQKKISPIVTTLDNAEQDLSELADRQTADAIIVSDDATILDEIEKEKRLNLFILLSKVERAARQRKITANKAYNASQEAARNDFNELGHRLATCAAWMSVSPIHKLRLSRSEVQRGDRFKPTFPSAVEGAEMVLISENPNSDPEITIKLREEALAVAARILRKVPLAQNHLFYSEAWNIFLNAGRLEMLIKSIEDSISVANEEGRYITSYAHGILAQAYAMQSAPEWRPSAQKHVDDGVKKLSHESKTANWYSSAIVQLTSSILDSGLDRTVLTDCAIWTEDELEMLKGLPRPVLKTLLEMVESGMPLERAFAVLAQKPAGL